MEFEVTLTRVIKETKSITIESDSISEAKNDVLQYYANVKKEEGWVKDSAAFEIKKIGVIKKN